MRVYLNYNNDGGVAYHRVLCPTRFCHPDFAALGHEIVCGTEFPSGKGWHGIHGLPYAETLLPLARHKRQGGKLVWGLDDDMPNIPEWSPARPSDPNAMNVWQLMKDLADLIIVSTDHLASTLKDVAHKVRVCPNLTDLSVYPAWDVDPETGAVDTAFRLPVKVLWAGSSTHKEDTRRLVEPLDELMRRFTKQELFVVWYGDSPPGTLIRDHLSRGVLWHQPGTPFPYYQNTLNQIRPDICLAPLQECEFNRSKSAIRVYEAWGMQACPVATPFGPYNVIRSGIDGRYANSADEWLTTISRLVVDHNYRIELAQEGRRRVECEFNWANYENRLPWLKAFAEMLECSVPNK